MDTLTPLPDVAQLAQALLGKGWRLATAESCTGGLIAGACTELAGSSEWFDRGFVSYSNAAKSEMLGVDAGLIAAHGAVSEPVARAMAEGALHKAAVEIAVAVTGIAGPGGGSAAKPVGTVWFAWAVKGRPVVSAMKIFAGDRATVRAQTCSQAIAGLIELLA